MTDPTSQASGPSAVAVNSEMLTGPAGLIVGVGSGGPVTLRLFRQQPTRLFLATPEYMVWLVAFRAMCLGAHLSVLVEDHRPWLMLADTVRACGGTIDLLRGTENIPGRGRPYRPSLIVNGMDAVSANDRIGAWQALVSLGDPEESRAVGDLRAADVALISPLTTKGSEHLRRAYALSSGQARAATDLGEAEAVLAGVRRVMRVPVVPSPTEHRLLFGG